MLRQREYYQFEYVKRLISTTQGAATSAHRPDIAIKRLVSEGLYSQALSFYKQHVHPFESSSHTAFVFPSIAKACAHSQIHQSLGLQVHCNVIKNGLDSEFTVSNSIISMYCKFSGMENARRVFDEMLSRDTVSWNGVINGYIQNGLFSEALKMILEMYAHGFVPKPELIASAVSACVKSENWRLGRAMHALVLLDERIEKSVFVSTAFLDFYWRFDDSNTAFLIFDKMEEKNVVSWTSMISGCIDACDYFTGFMYFRAMQVQHMKPNRVTLITILPACADLDSILLGKEIHGYAIRHGFDSDSHLSSTLLHMYCESGEGLKLGKLIFEKSGKDNIVMWSVIISGYSHRKDSAREAIRLFNEMQKIGILPNNVTILAVISACANLASLLDGFVVHGCSLKLGLGTNLFIQNALINMYSKCGDLKDSVQVFDEMATRDCVSWSALIHAYGLYGYADEALLVFNEMRESGIKADEVIYLAVLSTCNNAGLVDEGQMVFDRALKDADVSLTMEHYACYIDLLGRAGKLENACDVVDRMPMAPSPRIWSSLVFACKLHGKLDIAESLACKLVSVQPDNPANHTLFSMVYAETGKWSGMEEVRRYMKERKLRKSCSFSKILYG
ncbi:LOW QUALITY PROTEIN: pentatricopeptide repeat-containing protein At4g31070, mitochondrial-like [Primulina tabacum]|uniref:LOW QUALITY PROTEIN: pentatricopeptide repeat-containing protein At4g31070, mitochondrial-like n=1 Tax=Primulina tabacum TaxID=48773 RepID=UPI003F5A50CD